MVKDLRDAFKIDNLRRAWRWLNTNSDAFYKSYFRDIYTSYGIALNANLSDLSKRLKSQEYQPQHATKIYLPKKSGIQRTYSLLTVEDQIVYQALVNVIAERLHIRVKGRYLIDVFGNLYSGRTSKFFYKNWRKCYPKFGTKIRETFNKGFLYSASFDLTACYDSIDHKVLRHFLTDLGLQKEFSEQLCYCLSCWTAAMAENRIYQGHGIPQGPLSSGLLSEVVLRYFDENRPVKPKHWRYFRYVDDIRFFAKNEHDLRKMLVEMDLLSKKIGLFPQSSKIDIHKVANIDDEVKSISNPPEAIDIQSAINQKLVLKRIRQLTAKYRLSNETRFKYVLGSATPNLGLSKRLLKILVRHPHLYVSIFRYFAKYPSLSQDLSLELLAILKSNLLYAAFTAEGLRTLFGRCDTSVSIELEKFANEIIKSHKNDNGELLASAYSILFLYGKMGYREIIATVKNSSEWWARCYLLNKVDIKLIGEPSYQHMMNEFIKDEENDVASLAASLLIENSLNVTTKINKINRVAQSILKEAGLINLRRGGSRPISAYMQDLLGPKVKSIDWKTILGANYAPLRPKVSLLRSYAETNASAWVNLLDTIHDNMMEGIFIKHSALLGNYQPGNIGACLNPTSRFAKEFPITFKAFKILHQKRLDSLLSHAINKTTRRPTVAIEHRFIENIKPILCKSYLEIWGKW